MIFLLLSPFGIIALFRIFLPLFWCIEFLYTHGLEHYGFTIVLTHALYLILQGILLLMLMIYIVNLANKNRVKRRNRRYVEVKDRAGRWYAKFALIGIILFFVLNYQDLPLFSSGGSDAIMTLGEDQKIKTWLMYGLLGMLSYILIFSIIYTASKNKKYSYGLILIMSAIVTGKKAAIISIFGKFIFVYYVLAAIKPSFPIAKIVVAIVVSSLFIVYQFSRTAGFEFDVIDTFQILTNLIYSSSTVYLVQLIDLDGVSYAAEYSDKLGPYGPFTYVFNPFLKLLFGIGIYKAPGPYLGEVLFNMNSANGANMTLFFEYIFIFGSPYFALLATFHMIAVLFLAKFFIKKVINDIHTNFLITVTYFSLFLACFIFLFDSLYAVRSLPFIVFPYVLYIFFYFIKIGIRKKHLS